MSNYDSDAAAEAAARDWREQRKLDKISHALDHALSSLEFEPWEASAELRQRIQQAVAQIKYIQDTLL